MGVKSRCTAFGRLVFKWVRFLKPRDKCIASVDEDAAAKGSQEDVNFKVMSHWPLKRCCACAASMPTTTENMGSRNFV
jgi:hypothetical protein